MPRLLIGLSALALIALGAVVFMPEHGNETCLGCRAERAVEHRAGMTSIAVARANPCSAWVAANIPAHEHVWRKTGCWDAPLASEAECFPVPAQLGAPAEDWLAYLQSLPLGARPATVAQMMDDDTVLAVVAAFDAWRTARVRERLQR